MHILFNLLSYSKKFVKKINQFETTVVSASIFSLFKKFNYINT